MQDGCWCAAGKGRLTLAELLPEGLGDLVQLGLVREEERLPAADLFGQVGRADWGKGSHFGCGLYLGLRLWSV